MSTIQPDAAGGRPGLPDGARVYAIGDVHGRLDLLHELHEHIRADLARGPRRHITLVYLGDYVDRGEHSADVIDALLARDLPADRFVHLRGNHEDTLLRFLDDVEAGPGWLRYGGVETLRSYGVEVASHALSEPELLRVRAAFEERLPHRHRAFLAALPPAHAEGGYFFAHAGVRPGLSLERQEPEDLMWIRGEFLRSVLDHGKVVVHGHTPTDAPQLRPNRIGIDTGAFWTGTLTCAVLEGSAVRFLQTGGGG